MGITFSQFFPPTPTLTENNLPSQAGKVFIITGGTSGVGLELATILYRAGGKVYIAGRSAASAQKCIEHIKASSTSKPLGQLEFLALELDDLSTIKSSADSFMKKETKLDVLWNNAGVSQPALGSVSKQGFELQMATNCLGPFLFTQYLLPCLKAAAKESKPGAIRVIWTHSQFSELTAPKDGIIMSELDTPPKDQVKNYNNSKIGNWFLASELAKEVGEFGILSVSQNPGNLKTNLMRNAKSMYYAAWPLLYKAKMGAYTELWAGLSEGLKMENNGACVVPWGRIHPGPREDLLLALKGSDEGGSGTAKKFWDWCEGKTTEYR
ncbi:hypothetical protein BGAL_0197g00050 [Botrytis galanthina]|uniref:Short-chain dehydrogenase n=1 Tax=Botrytis galanthina TaxID=278940 RepID=A0A4S8QVV6_9HELO|nr:hypothetical protein BGAL_0197g00050 [Botrytis galanthina]